MNSNKSEDIFWNLRQNESITNETIISLIKYEFDSNKALNALNFGFGFTANDRHL